VPARSGPCELGELAGHERRARPEELGHFLTGAVWEPGSLLWLVHRRRDWVGDPGADRGDRPAAQAAGIVMEWQAGRPAAASRSMWRDDQGRGMTWIKASGRTLRQ
jgi:hypothetical protein